jgi:uncharacterized membrane protein
MVEGHVGQGGTVDVDAPTTAVEEAAWLDRVADVVEPRLAPLGRGAVRRVLSGEWQGHPLHPLLTDLPVGFWTTSFVLDLVGGRSGRAASQRCIGLGLLSVPATAAAGWSDWLASDGESADGRDDAVRRTGVAHAALNGSATAAYAASWVARRRGRYGAGVAWGMAGATLASAAGHLGGHLIFRLGAGVAAQRGGEPSLAAGSSP